MILSIDPASGLPIYLQIVQQIKWRVATGTLRPDDRLPSVRELASQLRVNPNTVAKAISELERAGIVQTRRGSGTFVAEGSVKLTRAERRRLVRGACERTVVDAHHLRWPAEDLRALLDECIDSIYESED